MVNMTRGDRELLLESVIPLIHKMATDFANRGLVGSHKAIETQDLVQTGLLAVWSATEKFDPKRGVKFVTYAYPTIYRAMSDEVRQLSGPVSVPQQFMQYVINSVAQTQLDIMQETGIFPTLEELVKDKKLRHKIRRGPAYADVAPEILDEHIKEAVRYLEGQEASPMYYDEDGEQIDPIEIIPDDTEENDPQYMSEMTALVEDMLDALYSLPDLEREVLELRFGIIDDKSWTLRDVADRMGISKETVRRIEYRGLQNLRRLPNRYKLKDYLD